MFGQPVASIAPGFRVLREIEGIAQGLCGAAAHRDRGQVENGKMNHRLTVRLDRYVWERIRDNQGSGGIDRARWIHGAQNFQQRRLRAHGLELLPIAHQHHLAS